MFRKPVDKSTHLIAIEMLNELAKLFKSKAKLMDAIGIRKTQYSRWQFGDVRVSEETFSRIKELYKRKDSLCPTTQKSKSP